MKSVIVDIDLSKEIRTAKFCEACAILNMGEDLIKPLIIRKYLNPIFTGGKYVFPLKDLDDFLEKSKGLDFSDMDNIRPLSETLKEKMDAKLISQI